MTRRVGFNDGQGRVNYEIAAEALRQGHQVSLFSEHVDSTLAGSGGVRVELMPAPAWLPTRLPKDQVYAWRTRQRLLAEAGRCDAVLANGFVTWAKADVNAVHFVHGSWLRSPHHPWRQRRNARSFYRHVYNRLNASLERGAFRRSRKIVAVSGLVRRELVASGVPVGSIVTITNGVDGEEFRPGKPCRARFGLPDGAVIGLFAGDLKDSRKNLDTVLRAMQGVPPLHLAVAGCHEGTRWPAMAAQLGIGDRVCFLGFQRDVPELMQSVDLFVFPSRYETSSLVLLEALASGLPVVTARSVGAAEIITPETGVVLEDSEDAAALAAALRALAGSLDRRRAMGAAGRALALHHSWPAMAARYVALLETAAEERRHGA